MIDLEKNISSLHRIGKATEAEFKGIGVEKIRDLLFYFPFRYDDFSRTIPIDDLKTGENANIIGRVELISGRRSPRRRLHITEALIRDESGVLKAVWFNQPFITRMLQAGDAVSLAGKTEENYGAATMISPVYEKIGSVIHSPENLREKSGPEKIFRPVHTHGLVPVYHLGGRLTHKQVRFFISLVLSANPEIADWLPEEVRKKEKLSPLSRAVRLIHFPDSRQDILAAKRRLAFDELFLIQLESRLSKRQMDSNLACRLRFFEEETKEFVAGLPFKLTGAQRKAAWEILRDLEKERPMARMMTGDVGSGKTVVAAVAILNTVLNGKQAALMAPTEILAKQHYETFVRIFSGLDIGIGLITSGEIKSNRESRPAGAAGGKAGNKGVKAKGGIRKTDQSSVIGNSQVIIGTHALIEEKVKFRNLSLAVIDEQHRFGVEQRKALIAGAASEGISKKFSPHFLSMTATPIPRSLALALYGDLDVSFINEMPAGRKKVVTRVVPEEKREAAYGFVRKKIMEGRQAFVVCPLIDASDKLGVKSAKEEFVKLSELIFPGLEIGLLHGRMKPGDKEKVMRRFMENKIKILVSTSVIEVGVDIPNAAVMMIEAADRFGLAQLHQFRGRVGRSGHQSYCLLFYDGNSDKTLKRLRAMEKESDGFKLAEIDLAMRGPGEVYGTAQKGFPELKMAELFDYPLMRAAKEEAEKIVAADPSLKKWPLLKERLGDWEKSAHPE